MTAYGLQSRRAARLDECPLLGEQPTWSGNTATSALDPNRMLRAPRRELWYPPSNAMGRFNEAADPQMALAARVERPRVLAGLHDSTKWPGIPTSLALLARADEVIE